MRLEESHMQIQTEPLATRVALHPLRAGEFANRFYLIESGKVLLESGAGFGDPVVIEKIGPGDLLGWSWMFPPHVWQFTARAVEPAAALFFHGTILREYCEKDHSLGYELFKRMSVVMMKRLQAARKQMLSVHVHGASLASSRFC